MTTARSYEGVAVVCPVTVPYRKRSERPAHWFVGAALKGLLDASGLEKSEVDGLAVSSFTLAPDTTIAVTEHLDMSPRWIEWLPTGGASGVMALRRAARAVQDGDASVVACIGADTSSDHSFSDLVRNFSDFSSRAVYPYGATGPNGPFALITDNYMRRFGATREDFGRLAVAQRVNAADNPNALLGNKPLTLADYLNAPPIAEPIHLFDCVMPCAGAEAFLVMSQSRARTVGLRHAVVLGAIERHNAYFEDPVAERGGWRMDRGALFEQAAVAPADIDCLQTYDDYPVISFLQVEGLGFCEDGAAADFLRRHTMTVDGTFPVNTSGGQLSCGQPGAAGGFLPVVEALRQVTDQPLGRRTPGARLAIASGYGMVTYDRCLATGAVLLEGCA